ncbi:MAG: tRNA epoxyqueuosine(34) reductase QueG [Bacteroidota bacterium]
MNPVALARRTEALKEKAYELGFMYVGISKAEFLEDEAPRLERWLQQGKHGRMAWMENYFDKRLDPTKLVEGAKSVVSLAYNYFPEEEIFHESEGYKIAKYAYGKDYHRVLKKKLKTFIFWLKEQYGDINGRAFVDSAPVLEKAWAARSGIGWQGKNSNLISKQVGSFFFLSELILDLDFEYDSPIKDYCGNCRLCLDACPTDAIPEPYVVDGSKCISYLTIELKEQIPTSFGGKWQNWIFGCDICQDVCPWNRRAKAHQEVKFAPNEKLKGMKKSDWEEITEELFEELFVGSAIKRTKFEGLRRNIKFLETPEAS